MKGTIAYFLLSTGDWGGSSRALLTCLKYLDKDAYRPLVLLPAAGPVVAQLQRLGVRYEVWGEWHEPHGPLVYLRGLLKALRFFTERRIDIIHCNRENYWRPAEFVAARLLGIPIVSHYHVVIENPSPAHRFYSLIVANSRYTADASEPRAVPKEVIHCSVDLERFDGARDIRPELGIPPDKIVVSFIGQIREIKGIDLFLRLARAVRDERAVFLIAGQCRDPRHAGDGYTRERLAQEIGDCANIEYIGYRSDVEHVYRASDVVVVPSQWQEPFGLTNIEAGAARRPVIASRVGGIPEIITHGENGFLVDREDLAALVHYTQALIGDAALRARMGRKGREVVAARFTEAPVRRLEALYDGLLEGRRGLMGIFHRRERRDRRGV